MAYGKKLLSVDFKKDKDAIIAGALGMFALLVLPGVSGFVYDNLIVPVRSKIGALLGGQVGFKG